MKMKKIILFLFFLSLASILTFESCDNKVSSNSTNEKVSDEKPSNPDVKTDYGELPGGYKTMDEYYIDAKGNKVWHGRRVNFYPSGAKKMEAFYEYGESKGYIKYDEAGNVTEDTRK